MSKSLYKKVSIASLIMMASVFLSRLIGIFREMVLAYIGGAGGEVDAYLVAFVIPDILNHVVATGFLSITFIPIFSHYLVQNREDEGWKIFSTILICFGSLLVLFITISIIFTDDFISIIAPGLDDPVLKKSAVRMTRIIMPAQFFFFVGGLFMAVQFAKERFLIPALAPVLYNIGIITGGVVLGPWIGVEGFSWGVLAGAFVGNFGIQYIGAKKAGMKFYPAFNIKHPDLRKYIWLTLPLMVGLTMTFSTEFFLKFFGSYLHRGSIASLNYSLRIMLILAGLFGQAMGMASFPFMARLVAEQKIEEMNNLLNNTLKYLSLVIPFSVLLMVLRHEVVLILFQRGRFDAAATEITAGLLIFLLAGAFAFSAQTVVVRGYYAMQNTIFPAVFTTVTVLLSIPLYIYGMQTMGAKGVAMVISISAIFQVTLLYAFWNRKSENKESRGVYSLFARMILLSIIIGVLLEWFKIKMLAGIDSGTFTGNLVISAVTGVVFSVIFLLAGHIFKIKEITEMVNKLVKKFKEIFVHQ